MDNQADEALKELIAREDELLEALSTSDFSAYLCEIERRENDRSFTALKKKRMREQMKEVKHD